MEQALCMLVWCACSGISAQGCVFHYVTGEKKYFRQWTNISGNCISLSGKVFFLFCISGYKRTKLFLRQYFFINSVMVLYTFVATTQSVNNYKWQDTLLTEPSGITIILKGQCHQIRITLKWGILKGISKNMRCLIFKIFSSLSLIYYRHFNFLRWGSKRVQIFHFVLNLIWGCSKWVQIALYASWNNSDFQCLFLIGCLISCIFYNRCSICVLNVAGVAL